MADLDRLIRAFHQRPYLELLEKGFGTYHMGGVIFENVLEFVLEMDRFLVFGIFIDLIGLGFVPLLFNMLQIIHLHGLI